MKILMSLILCLCFLLTATIAAAVDCTIGLAWTPDPATSAITEQEVWYNPDGVPDSADEVLKSPVTPTTIQYEWTDVGVSCPTGATVYIVTKYLTGTSVKSSEASIQSVVGAIISIVVQHQ